MTTLKKATKNVAKNVVDKTIVPAKTTKSLVLQQEAELSVNALGTAIQNFSTKLGKSS